MARTPTAMNMLKDITSETAQQLLNTVRYQTDPPRFTMLRDLDNYILDHREAGAPTRSSLHRGDVIEIQGPAASGKTQLLYHLVACCVLPKEVLVMSNDLHAAQNVHIGGWNRSVIVLDCDGRWDARRLHNILVTRLDLAFSKKQLPPPPHKPHTTVSSVALQALSCLHVFRPRTSSELVATLLNLPKYHAEKMPNEEIGMLVVDSISAFYWADRWQAELSNSKNLRVSNPLKHVLRCLRNFRASHGPVIALTNWGLLPLPTTPFYKQHLMAPFPSPFEERPRRFHLEQLEYLPLNFQITLSAASIPLLQLADGHEGSLEDFIQMQEKRREVLDRGEIEGYVRIPRTDRERGTASQSEPGRFRFRILERDVVEGSIS